METIEINSKPSIANSYNQETLRVLFSSCNRIVDTQSVIFIITFIKNKINAAQTLIQYFISHNTTITMNY